MINHHKVSHSFRSLIVAVCWKCWNECWSDLEKKLFSAVNYIESMWLFYSSWSIGCSKLLKRRQQNQWQYSNTTRTYTFVWPASSRSHKQNVQIGFWTPSAAWIRKATLWLQQCRVLGRLILSSCANRCGNMPQKRRKTWKNNKQAAYRYDYVYVYVCFLYSKYMLQSLQPSFPPAQRCPMS